MGSGLKISVGQCSDKGVKEINQDFHGVLIPDEPQLSNKGVVVALADGISSSNVSQIASETAVKGFITDYYCTSDAWTVKHSAQQVLKATNSWLNSQTRNSPYRYNRDRGYVCTFSAVVIKGSTLNIFHVGDSRVYQIHGTALEPLTKDHRLQVSQSESYLARALGMDHHLDLDIQSLPINAGDHFMLATDGVFEFVSDRRVCELITEHADNLDRAAEIMVQEALGNGSDDNLTVQLVRIDQIPTDDIEQIWQQNENAKPPPPQLEPRMSFDGYRIIRQLHMTSRSHVFLAEDEATKTQVVIKTPSIEMRESPEFRERFLLEEWIARRITSPHVLKVGMPERPRNYLYTVAEFIEGQTLEQWLIDHPKPSLTEVRSIIEQVAKGLRAFHKLEMIYQDVKPDNVMIDHTGTVKIIDFGAVAVGGLMEFNREEPTAIMGTALYTAPEYFLGMAGTPTSDQFSLGVMAYYMLSGRFPYGTQVARARTQSAQHKLHYESVLDPEREIPGWVDHALKRAVHPDPFKRYDEISEFVFDLSQPNKKYLQQSRPPLMERDPVAFWQGVSFLLFCIIVFLITQ